MKSFCKDNIRHKLLIAIPTLCFGIILNSCKKDLANTFLPRPSSAPATSITQTEATLSDLVYLEGNSTTIKFEYDTSLSYRYHTSSDLTPKGIYGNWVIHRNLTGLSPGTTYHFRLVATNGNGTTNGNDQTFTTLN
jgi:hypothetical protein